MIPLHTYLLYLIFYTVAVATPGPGILAIIARALGNGFRATVPAVAGNTLGDLIQMSLSAFGFAVIAREMGGLFLIVRLAGAAYLIWMGYKYWSAQVADVPVVEARARQGFMSQLMLTLGNPKSLIFWLALMPTVVDLSRLDGTGYVQLVAATLLVIPGVELAYALLASQARTFLSSAMARKRINKGAGAIMIGAGIGVAVN